MSHITHSYMRHDSFIYDTTHSHVTWLIHTSHDPVIRCSMSGLALLIMSHGSFTCETWLVYIWHDSSKRNMTHSYASRTRTHSYASRTRKKTQYVWARSTGRHVSLVWHLCVPHTHTHTHTHTPNVMCGHDSYIWGIWVMHQGTWLIHMGYEVVLHVTWPQAIWTEETSIWNTKHTKPNNIYDIFAPLVAITHP